MNIRITEAIANSIKAKENILHDPSFLEKIELTAQLLVASLRGGGHIYFCGNGGSAADAQHLAAELSGRFYLDRPALGAEALHCNTSYLTAVANDYGYDNIFARLLQGLGHPDDVLVGLSTSGNSANIVNAFDEARHIGMHRIAFTGRDGGRLMSLSDFCFNVPSEDTPRIQECHIMVGHILCDLVEQAMFAK